MAAASVVLIVRCVLRLQRPAEVEAGSRLHRGALLLVLVGWAVLIPVVGFFLASVAGFVASALTARYEPWSAPRWAGLLAMAVAAVGVFYGLFSEVLRVPFPQGWLWGGSPASNSSSCGQRSTSRDAPPFARCATGPRSGYIGHASCRA